MSDDAEQQKKTLMRELDAWPVNLTNFERAYNKIYGTGVYGTGIIFEQVFSELIPGFSKNLAVNYNLLIRGILKLHNTMFLVSWFQEYRKIWQLLFTNTDLKFDLDFGEDYSCNEKSIRSIPLGWILS